jgi:hypothetical protein
LTPHIMLDLETLGVSNTPVLLSIGAVKFTEDEIVDSFHVRVDPMTCQLFKLKIDASTVMWWLDGERADARTALLGHEQIDLPSALRGFAQWMGEPTPVWGNGASADNVWMRNAYEAIGDEAPWPFWMDRCYRTLKNLAPEIEIAREQGVHHDALADATCQARHLQAIIAHLGIRL